MAHLITKYNPGVVSGPVSTSLHVNECMLWYAAITTSFPYFEGLLSSDVLINFRCL